MNARPSRSRPWEWSHRVVRTDWPGKDAYGVAVAACLLDHVNDRGVSKVGFRTIRRETTMANDTIADRIERLVAAGLIERVGTTANGARRWYHLIGAELAASPPGPSTVPPGGATVPPGRRDRSTRSSRPSHPVEHMGPRRATKGPRRGRPGGSAGASPAGPARSRDELDALVRELDADLRAVFATDTEPDRSVAPEDDPALNGRGRWVASTLTSFEGYAATAGSAKEIRDAHDRWVTNARQLPTNTRRQAHD